jgi:tetratricopeptide (TPR) repeat protein
MVGKCSQIQRCLDDYRQGVLLPDAMEVIESHLASCPMCQGVYEEREALAALLRAAPELPQPSTAHLAVLNRAVAEHIVQRGPMSALLAGPITRIRDWWHHPLSERTVALAGAAALLLLGVWMGGAMLGPTLSGDASRPHASSGDVAHAPAVASRSLSSSDSVVDPFDGTTIYVIPEQAPGSRWSTLDGFAAPVGRAANAQFSEEGFSWNPSSTATPGRYAPVADASSALREAGRVTYPLVLIPHGTDTVDSFTRAGGHGETRLSAQSILEDDLLGKLNRFKLDLYRTGETDLIPDVHMLEEVLAQILVSQPGGGTSSVDVNLRRRFAVAESHLLRRDFRRAEEVFNEIAHHHSDATLAALAWYHLGDIYYDFHGDFAAARQCYERATEAVRPGIFPPEILSRMEHRMTLLRDSAQAEYDPLNLLRQAEAAPAGTAMAHYRRLLMDYSSSAVALDAIKSLTERAVREIPDSPDLPFEAIDLLRHYQRQPGATHCNAAQLHLADIVYHRLGDLPQAMIEYQQVKIEPGDGELEGMVRDRIAQILDNRLSQRIR